MLNVASYSEKSYILGYLRRFPSPLGSFRNLPASSAAPRILSAESIPSLSSHCPVLLSVPGSDEASLYCF
ncbi:hypothetical protein XENORESO_002492 [Xenotaenia resolanae]|uniref:Uncharacterized protein n=1 Tax=Xenotaenia resolanae TaxID=208358 RepID=A0ABV0VNH0_9TELE